MHTTNKTILQQANDAIINGDHEGFLAHCTEDTEWRFIGDTTLRGKQAVREWMAKNYQRPPQFKVNHMVAENDFVIALGEILVTDGHGKQSWQKYCDVWKFREGKMAHLEAFVIQPI